ncbi:hypothetical protein GCM10010102_04030 [Promicromonospora citrea]|uniref:Uncharacterized protein n=1 Tax=Promicromonospora citrea TaxID=43677 RepID=A0A8H9L2E6_9MICO|nr:hypothetical protein GCM10010102_04030 [Promicromonospora citrea]
MRVYLGDHVSSIEPGVSTLRPSAGRQVAAVSWSQDSRPLWMGFSTMLSDRPARGQILSERRDERRDGPRDGPQDDEGAGAGRRAGPLATGHLTEPATSPPTRRFSMAMKRSTTGTMATIDTPNT